MPTKKQNKRIGSEVERLFARNILKNDNAISAIKNKFNISGMIQEVHPTGANQRKSDVLILFQNNYSIGVNIKAGKTDFNQITRIWLTDFVNKLSISNIASEAIQYGIDNYRIRNRHFFIEEQYQDIVKKEFYLKLSKILELIFKGLNNDVAKILALYDRLNGQFYMYSMDEVLRNLSESKIEFSNNGIIKIGDYLSLQRKGGNGARVKYLKSDPNHPGNQIQFKMKINTFINEYNNRIATF